MAQVAVEVVAEVDDALRDLNRLEDQTTQYTGTNKQAGLSLTDLKAGLDLALGAFNTVKGAVESVINPTIEYGKQVRDLGSFAGITAEESSRLIQVADDLGIEFNTLRTAAKAMTENGLQPSVKTLAELSEEYNAIQDPVKQAQFLVDTFGARAGPQLAYALKQGGAALRQMGEDAEQTGLVVGEDFVQSAREAEIAIDNWEDSVMALKITLSLGLLPVLTEVINATNDSVTYSKLAQQAAEQHALTQEQLAQIFTDVRYGTMSSAEAVEILAGALNFGGTEAERFAHVTEDVAEALPPLAGAASDAAHGYAEMGAAANDTTPRNYALKDSIFDVNQELNDLQTLISGDLGKANEDYYEQQKDLGAQIAETKEKLDDLRASHGQVVDSTIDGAAAARELIIAQSEAQTAAEKLKTAQEKLAEDPGDLGLQAAVARAEGALVTAQGHVEEWSGKVSQANDQFTIDNSEAIAKTEEELAGLETAYGANADAHTEATHRILFNMLTQQLATDGLEDHEYRALAGVAEAWGLLDHDTGVALANMGVNIANLNNSGDWRSFVEDFTNIRSKEVTVTVRHQTIYSEYGAEPGPGVPVNVPDTSSDYQQSVNGMQ